VRESGCGAGDGHSATHAFAPQRFIAPEVLAACDAWVRIKHAAAMRGKTPPGRAGARSGRCTGMPVCGGGTGLVDRPWLAACRNGQQRAVDALRVWQGAKAARHSVALRLHRALRAYRHARGLPPEPAAHEQVPLIHGFKGGSLQETGLYREVKAIFDAVAMRLDATDPARALLLRTASPHWLRHAYAKTLVVAHKMPLPVAQALLGHASVQTTAAYAKTDLSQLREFDEVSFTACGK
jgi:integrase/recombinase XerC